MLGSAENQETNIDGISYAHSGVSLGAERPGLMLMSPLISSVTLSKLFKQSLISFWRL